MTFFDWSLVVLLNGSIIAYGIYLSRGVKSSADWFLAGRTLPWWLVGLSMYATAIDSSDLVADSGGTYTMGISYFVTNWVGVVGGWALGAFIVFLPMYRAGMYTNAEYLEARFGPAVRVICALIQVQYRTLVLAIIATTLYLTLSIVCGMGTEAWWAVGGIAVLATIYTSLGGLKSVAITDALQFGVMTVAALIIWCVVWNQVGGWQGIEQKLSEHDRRLPGELMHVGHDDVVRKDASKLSPQQIERKLLFGGRYDANEKSIVQSTPAWIVAIGLIIAGMSYSIVNHTQAMRMFASKSQWDMKMAIWVAGAVMLAMTFFNLSMGIMGRALVPDQSVLPDGRQDAIYPYLVSLYTTVGLKGIVVAGVLAASFSTFDSIGSTLSALLTRDVYARFMVRNSNDRHYLRVGQWLTPLIIGGSFLYVPFLLEGEGMLLFYLDLTSAFVVPLLTLFLMGVLTRVHRRSGLIGIFAGSVYGIVRLMAAPIADHYGVAILPGAMVNPFAAYLFSVSITAGTTLLVSLVAGWEPRDELLHEEKTGWLRTSQLAIQKIDREAAKAAQEPSRFGAWLPLILAAIVVVIGCVLSFIIFW